MAAKKSNEDPHILIINDLIENQNSVLEAIRNICTKNTVIYSWIPNTRSFHRLLAVEMGIVENVYEKSGHDTLFQRQNVYDIETFNSLMTKNRFKVVESGSYFVKPFTHDQMDRLLNQGIVNKSCLEGLKKKNDQISA